MRTSWVVMGTSYRSILRKEFIQLFFFQLVGTEVTKVLEESPSWNGIQIQVAGKECPKGYDVWKVVREGLVCKG